MNHTTILAAGHGTGSNSGTTILLLMLGAGIFVGLKSKKLTITELLVCGTFGGLLFTVTGFGSNLSSMAGALGSHIASWVGA